MRWIIVPVACMLLAGCAPYSSYPPVEETSGLSHPTFEPVPTIIVAAIEWGRSREQGETAEAPLSFVLPRDSSDKTYEKIEKRIEGSERASSDRDGIAIRSVRIRGFDASVDVSVPRDRGEPILYTIDLKSKPFQKWEVVAHRRWRFHETDIAAVEYSLPTDTSVQAEQRDEGE
ncbi:MAG: hypothetical protein CMJ24_11320 [Phycisphaerae bacterium]|nr:hypothetical protein [Phycisphaerae bacterium]MDG1899754.1 hypothetical protein [Phycisphaerales bacterium]